MLKKIAVLALAAMVLSGCGSMSCGAAGDDNRTSGGCRAHTTF
jgi:predicted small secreted protein